MSTRWSEKELLQLERVWSVNADLSALALELGRSVWACQKMAHRNGFGPRRGFTIAELARTLGYERKTIKRAAMRLGFYGRRSGAKRGSWWALSEDQVKRLLPLLEQTRTVRR
jgi:hypothetical protein